MTNSRGTESLADLAAETGAVLMPVGEATQGADVVILAIPKKGMPQLRRESSTLHRGVSW